VIPDLSVSTACSYCNYRHICGEITNGRTDTNHTRTSVVFCNTPIRYWLSLDFITEATLVPYAIGSLSKLTDSRVALLELITNMPAYQFY
jgi:hypothetical protein